MQAHTILKLIRQDIVIVNSTFLSLNTVNGYPEIKNVQKEKGSNNFINITHAPFTPPAS